MQAGLIIIVMTVDLLLFIIGATLMRLLICDRTEIPENPLVIPQNVNINTKGFITSANETQRDRKDVYQHFDSDDDKDFDF